MKNVKKSATVYVKINQTAAQVSPQSSAEDFVELTEKKLQEISDIIRTSCSSLAKRVLSLPSAPEEITMEFGVDVGGEAGIPFVTKGTINANFKVSVVWRSKNEKG